MKRIISKMQITADLLWHRPSLRSIGFVSLILCLLFLFNTGFLSVSASYQQMAVHHPIQLPALTSSHTDIVLVVDNINEIKLHDPTGARFWAAQMFVDQAQPGNHIGVVRVSSSDISSPVNLLDMTNIQSVNDKNTVKHVLTQSFFGSVDPGPTAYFAPALQTASQMLLSTQDTNRKYIIIMTDSLAQSGDQEPCPSVADPYHQWFCEVPRLQAQNISVIFFGFTIPGRESEIKPTQQYLEQHGGIVLQVG